MSDSLLEAILRGAGQGATANWGDEGSATILAALPGPKDPEGYSRTYAAGTPRQDYENSIRAANQAASDAHPLAYGAGQLAGAVPSALAVPGGMGATGAARIASAGAAGAGLGALTGAGAGDNGNRLKAAGQGALLGGAAGGLGGALAEDVALAGRFLSPGARQAVPTNVAAEAAGSFGQKGPLVDAINSRPAQRPNVPPSDSILPPIPKPGRTLSEAHIGPMEDLADASHVAQGAKNLGKSVPPEARALGQDANRRLMALDEPATGTVQKLPPAELGEFKPANDMPATVRPPRKKAAGPSKAAQQELPGIPEPEYHYHATPPENAASIAEVGLRPEQGGKNFAFKKNQGRVYMSGADEAPMWAEKLKDFSGKEPIQLRTPLKAEPVPGADKAVKVRTEPVPPERLQYKTPEGEWRPAKELKPAEPAPKPPNDYVQPNLFREHALKNPEEVQLQLPHTEDRLSDAVREKYFKQIDDVYGKARDALPQELADARFDWMGNGYEDIRAGQRAEPFNKLLEQTKTEAPGPIYRGLRLKPEDAARFRQTGVFPADTRPSSWALDPSDARRFSLGGYEETPVVLRMRGGTGSPMSASESEFVTQGHPRLRATRWTKEGPAPDEPYIVDVEPHEPVAQPVQQADSRQMTLEDMLKALRGR